MVQTDVPECFHLKILPCSSSPTLPIFKNVLLVINEVPILLHPLAGLISWPFPIFLTSAEVNFSIS